MHTKGRWTVLTFDVIKVYLQCARKYIYNKKSRNFLGPSSTMYIKPSPPTFSLNSLGLDGVFINHGIYTSQPMMLDILGNMTSWLFNRSAGIGRGGGGVVDNSGGGCS